MHWPSLAFLSQGISQLNEVFVFVGCFPKMCLRASLQEHCAGVIPTYYRQQEIMKFGIRVTFSGTALFPPLMRIVCRF
jgi:hypothetical protein